MQIGRGFFPLTVFLYKVFSLNVMRKSKAKSSGMYLSFMQPLLLKKNPPMQQLQMPFLQSHGILDETACTGSPLIGGT